MSEPEFDKFADEYAAILSASVSASGEIPDFFAEYKIRDIAREVGQNVGSLGTPNRMLDFGSGVGGSVPFVRRYFPGIDLTCVDVSHRSLAIAQRRFPSLARYVHFDGVHLPFPADYFDSSFASCVFHHIDSSNHVSMFAELRRVLRPSGLLFVFEHNPLNPLTVRVVNSCPFDEDAQLIGASVMRKRLISAGFVDVTIRYRIFFPHWLRFMRPLEAAMTWLPLGAQYYALARK